MYKSNNAAVIVKGARSMPCTLVDEESGKEFKINVKEPKLKVFKMFEKIGKDTEMSEIIETAAAILNSNRENIRIDTSFVEENFSLDDISQLFEDLSNWLLNTRNTDPN